MSNSAGKRARSLAWAARQQDRGLAGLRGDGPQSPAGVLSVSRETPAVAKRHDVLRRVARRPRLVREFRFGCVCGRQVRGRYALKLTKLEEALFDRDGRLPPLDRRKAKCDRCGRTLEDIDAELARRRTEGIPAWMRAR